MSTFIFSHGKYVSHFQEMHFVFGKSTNCRAQHPSGQRNVQAAPSCRCGGRLLNVKHKRSKCDLWQKLTGLEAAQERFFTHHNKSRLTQEARQRSLNPRAHPTSVSRCYINRVDLTYGQLYATDNPRHSHQCPDELFPTAERAKMMIPSALFTSSLCADIV